MRCPWVHTRWQAVLCKSLIGIHGLLPPSFDGFMIPAGEQKRNNTEGGSCRVRIRIASLKRGGKFGSFWIFLRPRKMCGLNCGPPFPMRAISKPPPTSAQAAFLCRGGSHLENKTAEPFGSAAACCMALGGVLCCFVYSSSARSRIRRSVFSQPRQASVMLLP